MKVILDDDSWPEAPQERQTSQLSVWEAPSLEGTGGYIAVLLKQQHNLKVLQVAARLLNRAHAAGNFALQVATNAAESSYERRLRQGDANTVEGRGLRILVRELELKAFQGRFRGEALGLGNILGFRTQRIMQVHKEKGLQVSSFFARLHVRHGQVISGHTSIILFKD